MRQIPTLDSNQFYTLLILYWDFNFAIVVFPEMHPFQWRQNSCFDGTSILIYSWRLVSCCVSLELLLFLLFVFYTCSEWLCCPSSVSYYPTMYAPNRLCTTRYLYVRSEFPFGLLSPIWSLLRCGIPFPFAFVYYQAVSQHARFSADYKDFVVHVLLSLY